PAFAYINPAYYGGDTGANLWAWWINFALVDGKMRGLFTMLFGASAILIAERAAGHKPGPWQTHYLRMFWLFFFGLINAYLIFSGDILVCYALAGLVIFPFRKLKPGVLIGIGAAILAADLAFHVWQNGQARALAIAAGQPGASAATVAALKDLLVTMAPAPGALEQQLAAFRGGFMDALKARMEFAIFLQTQFLPTDEIPEAIGQMLIGMGLYRAGFFTLRWTSRQYLAVIAFGYLVAAPVNAWLGSQIVAAKFDPISLNYFGAWSAAPRPFIALAHACVVLLAVRAWPRNFLIDRLSAAGRMALSNYLGAGILSVVIFCGFGLGLYGRLERAQLYLVVLAIWAVTLIWSKPWMERFHYGPFEWVWRSLVRMKPQPFVKRPLKAAEAAA
ncbi:MAG TPA: DUF418 domain-containing protein, partial [Caulobacteraceae bacterium]|nr:DUF418 domain-containing protein [Caulobacteraceae bacterium]